MVLKKEEVLDLVGRAYATAVEHGFHNEERSNSHFLMLVLSEIGEMVEADRKNRHADIAAFNDLLYTPQAVGDMDARWKYLFERYVKDTVLDEMADVVIRILDFCGTRCIDLGDVYDTSSWSFAEYFGDRSFCEQCYELALRIAAVDDRTEASVVQAKMKSALMYCLSMADYYHADLLWHVRQKMRYNGQRAVRHGKAY